VAKHAADVAEYERRVKLHPAERVLEQMEALWSGVAVTLLPLVRPQRHSSRWARNLPAVHPWQLEACHGGGVHE
jgi:hypothetical protein